MKMDMPYYKQETWYYCGPAVMQMIFSYFGTFVEQHKIAKLLSTDPSSQGTLCGKLECISCAARLKCDVSTDASYDMIQKYICQKIPVIVNYFDTQTQAGHYAIATSCNDLEITLNDPTYGKDHRLSKDAFLRYWYCGCGCSKRWMAAVSKSDNDKACEIKRLLIDKLQER